jgi:hypothetical protein
MVSVRIAVVIIVDNSCAQEHVARKFGEAEKAEMQEEKSEKFGIASSCAGCQVQKEVRC